MFFKKNKNQDIIDAEKSNVSDDINMSLLTYLQNVCVDGVIEQNAFVLLAEGIYVYADVLDVRENVAQVVFQIHHKWFNSPLVEAIVASGDNTVEALQNACQDFVKQILSIVMEAIHNPKSPQMIDSFTQEHHYYHVFSSDVYVLGENNKKVHENYWDMIGPSVTKRLGNCKSYWVKVFISKKKNDIVCEVRINGHEVKQISNALLSYIHEWRDLGNFHSEKQWFLLVQDDKSFIESDYTKKDIVSYVEMAMDAFEHCHDKDDYKKMQKQLMKKVDDESLVCEILGLIPELYCKYAYPNIEIGERLFLVKKDGTNLDLYQSQLDIFNDVDLMIRNHFKNNHPTKEAIAIVLRYSANARAVQKAIASGEQEQNLILPGIGFRVPDDYQIF